MEKEKIKKLIATYDKKAETAYMNYQNTGVTRYDTARRNAEELADALRLALNAKDEHDELLLYRSHVCQWAAAVKRIPYMAEDAKPEAMNRICQEVKALAKLKGLIKED